ncbi:fibronectin type III domain-containing protein 7 isoform X2 [Dunckerocampus dactyliophorus]|uniref:fibronectin type III domain-containing protein 7 isoform X2 n=1 Tax=Dunckerocampus dactyliophorus TaxID=161453 RepID=UPI0024064C77|nr:fibronectin type III domain-containing protein 7 isoform X2 [Dunckerocampus dactyliophorus]
MEKTWKLLIFLTMKQICTAENDITFTVFTVTSKSMTMQWTGHSGATSYKITATPKSSPERSVFVQFSGDTVMGSVNSLSPNTVYTMHFEAMDDALNVLSSAETEELTAPEVPSIEQAYSKHSDSITVEFAEVVGATSYILRAVSQSHDFFSETTVSSSPGTVVKLHPYTHYKLSIISINAGGRSQPSYPIKARTVLMAPMLNSTSPDGDTILVIWSPVEYAVLYSLCVIQQGSISRLKVNTTDNTLTFGDLEAGTTYCIKGTAWDSEGRAGDDLTVCQITRPPSPDVIHVQVTQGRALGIAVYWVFVQGAEEYLAWTTNGQNCTATTNNYCYISAVTCGQNHSVSVTAFNSAGPSTPSPPADYVTYPCPPDNIRVEEPNTGNCTVVWDEVPLVEFYMTFIKRDDGTEKFCNTTGSSCHFFCMCGYTYLTSVFPYNQAGSSPDAHVQNYTTIPCCPEGVSLESVSSETLEVTWSPVKGAELYETTAVQADEAIHSPCAPDILNMTQSNHSSYTVLLTAPNDQNTNYTVAAVGRYDTHTCHGRNSSCELTELPCGSTYDVTAVATTTAGTSLTGYSKVLETGPCCPTSMNVSQVTQAMTNVTWSAGHGAHSFIATLTSPRGHAKCHTMDIHCLMGCITCGTNYSVTLEAISSTGHMSECKYHGFSSSACCPTNVKLYRWANNSLRVYWRTSWSSQVQQHVVELYGTVANYTCLAAANNKYCDIQEETCGDVYTVVAAPVGADGVKVSFCQQRTYSVPCKGFNAALVISRGRRSIK